MAFCESCELAYKCNTNCMEGVGPSKAKIMIIGEAPSHTDDYEGQPFVGDMGSKLDYYLERAGIERDDCYITFAVKCKTYRPSDIKAKHTKACEPHLMREILSVRPKVIVAMGKAPVMQLMDQNSIGEFRGHFEKFELDYQHKESNRTFTTQIMPTYSPMSALTKWEYDDYIIHDLQKAKEFIKTGVVPLTPTPKWKLVLSLNDLKEFEERYTKADSFATDFETTGLKFFKHKIINAGFADDNNFATIVPMLEYGKEHLNSKKWTDEDRKFAKVINKFVGKHKKKIFKTLKRVHACRAKKILHNGKFDLKFAKFNKIPYKNFHFDTVIADALIDENKYHDLSTCMEFRGINYGPYDTKLWPYVNKGRSKKKSYQFAPPQLLCEYLAIDVCGDRRLYEKQLKELKFEGMTDLMMNQQMPLTNLMARCEFSGVKFNVEKLREIGRLFDAQILQLETEVKKLTRIPDLNLGSPKQLLTFFESKNYPFEEMEIKKGKTGYSCGEDTLKKFARKRQWAKIPTLILEHRTLKKMKGTFLDGKDGESGLLAHIDANNFIHTSYNIHTPRTGRMSSSEPNLQQIPRPNPKFPDANIRQLFGPKKKNWVLFSDDFAQLEMRVAAYLSNDRVMIKEIQDGIDLHTRNAVRFGTKLGFLPVDMNEHKFNEIRSYKPPEDWQNVFRGQPDKLKEIESNLLEAGIYLEHRNFAKTLGFGLNYGMDANTLAQQYSRDVDEVQEMIDLYFEKYYRLAEWREDIMAKSIDEGVLVLPETGRKRRFTQASDWFNSEYASACKKRDFDISAVHRQAVNFPVQGFANEIYVAGKLKLDRELRKRKMKSRILLSIHDGLIGEGPKHEMAMVAELSKKCMERVLGEGKWKVPLVIDFEMFDCWYGKKLKLEDMKEAA